MSNVINNSISEIEKAVSKIKEDVMTRDSIFTVKPIPLLPYPKKNELFEKFYITQSYGRDVYICDIIDYSMEFITKFFRGFSEYDKNSFIQELRLLSTNNILPIKKKNEEIIAKNKEQIEIIKNFMNKTLGLSLTRYETFTQRRKTYQRSVSAYWVDEVSKVYPTSDPEFNVAEKCIENSIRAVESYFGLKEKEEKEVAAKEEAKRLFNAAVQYLVERKKVPGKDFEVDNAVHVANDVALEEEIERLGTTLDFHDFSGSDSCEKCRGWDGKSHRCDCGNRRVSWVAGYYHSFEKPCAIAEAY